MHSRFDRSPAETFQRTENVGIQLTESQLRLQQRFQQPGREISSRTNNTTQETTPSERISNQQNRTETSQSNPINNSSRNTSIQSTSTTNNYTSNAGNHSNTKSNTVDQKAMMRKLMAQKIRARAAAVEKSMGSQQKHQIQQDENKLSQVQQNNPIHPQGHSRSDISSQRIEEDPSQLKQKQAFQSRSVVTNIQRQDLNLPLHNLSKPITPPSVTSNKKYNANVQPTNSNDDQKAKLRKILENSRAKRQNAAEQRISPRSHLIQLQRKSLSHVDSRKETSVRADRLIVKSKLSPKSSLMHSQRLSLDLRKKEQEIDPLVTASKEREPLKPVTRNVSLMDIRESPIVSQTIIARHTSLLDNENYTKDVENRKTSTNLANTKVQSFKANLTKLDTSPIAKKTAKVQTAKEDKSAKSPIRVMQQAEHRLSPSAALEITFRILDPGKFQLPPPEKELDSYASFYNVLKKEGANDHRELWRSFRTVFSSSKVELTHKQKRLKFDMKTKRLLTEMNLHLKRNCTMECKAETQLVNDKKYAKEIGIYAKRSPTAEASDLGFDLKLSQSMESDFASASREIVTASQVNQSDHIVIQKNLTTEGKKKGKPWLIITPSRSQDSSAGSEATASTQRSHPLLSDQKRAKAWLASFRSKQDRNSPQANSEEVDIQQLKPAPEKKTAWMKLQREKIYDRQQQPTQDNIASIIAPKLAIHDEVKTQIYDDSHEDVSPRTEHELPTSKVFIDQQTEIPKTTNQQSSWQVALRKRQHCNVTMPPIQSDTSLSNSGSDGDSMAKTKVAMDNLSPASSRKRRIAESQNQAPPWGKVQLKATRESGARSQIEDSTEEVRESLSFSRTKLRESKALVDSGESGDDQDFVALNHASNLEHANKGQRLNDEFHASPNKKTSLSSQNGYTKKSTAVQSFVPANDGIESKITWSQRKLKHVKERQAEVKSSVPWAGVTLRTRDDNGTTQDNVTQQTEEVSATTPFHVSLRKSSRIISQDNSRQNPESCEDSPSMEGTDPETSFQKEIGFPLGKVPKNVKDDSEETIPSRVQTTVSSSKPVIQTSARADTKAALSDFSTVQLRPVSREAKISEDSRDVQKSEFSDDVKGEAPEFLATKLRPTVNVSIKNETGSSKEDTKNVLSEMFTARLRPVPNPQGENSSVKHDAPNDDAKSVLSQILLSRQLHTSSKEESKEGYNSSQSSDVLDLLKIGKILDLKNELSERLVNLTLVDLWTAPGSKGEIVGLGNDFIFVAAKESDIKCEILWCNPRDGIESITLDLARNVADIIITRGPTKSLGFQNAESCLRFATAFYRTSDYTQSEKESAVATTSKESAAKNISSTNEASATEQLNQEEQELLKKFREARRVKGADDLLKAMIGDNDAEDDLSDDDMKVAERYKKMLAMQIPRDAVEHKMKLEGLEKKIVNFVLGLDTTAPQGATSDLTDDEIKMVESFQKMLKMGVPPEGVEHKMVKEGVDEKIRNAVLKSNPQPAISSTPLPKPKSENSTVKFSEEEETLIASYKKMLKMCIPSDAVRHRMKKDQASENVIHAVFPNLAKVSGQAPEKASSLTPEEKSIAMSYGKMLKMKIPPEAVRHKMTKDGVSEKIVAFVFGEEVNSNKGKGSELSKAETEAVATYKKMLTMHFPEDAVRHKMTKESASERVIKAVFGVQKKEAVTASNAAKSTTALGGSKLVALHWTPLSGEELDNSVWRVNKKRRVSTNQPETNDISKLVELFKKKSNPKAGGPILSLSNGNGTEKAKLIDLNRANNIAISLKAFKDFTNQRLAETIDFLDPQEQIIDERVQFLKDLLPNAQEVSAIKSYTGNDSRLVPAELFFRHLVPIKRIEVKVEVMKMMVTFRSNAAGYLDNYKLLERACLQAQKSEKLLEVLDMVLNIGNIMNEGTRTGGAAGFKFDSLLKLTQTKSSDGKTTVLDYLVSIFVAKNKRDILDLKSDFIDCQVASRMLISEMNTEVKGMSDALNACKSELLMMKKENGLILREIAATSESSAAADPRSALLGTIKARGKEKEGNENSTPSKARAANAYLDALSAKKNCEKANTEEESIKPGKLNLDVIREKCQLNGEKKSVQSPKRGGNDPEEVTEDIKDSGPHTPAKPKLPATAKGGITRLESFIIEADETMGKLQSCKAAAISSCKGLAKYFGESGGEQAATTLLGILSQFATNLSDAVKKYDKRLELEAKKAAQKRKEEDQARRKSFVESKGFGKIRAKEETPTKGSILKDFEESRSPRKLKDTNGAESDDHGDKNISQIHGDAKARVAPKAKTKGRSLISMVNQMLNQASPRARQDFEAGIVYENVEDETLKAIYEKERETILRSPPRRTKTSTNLDLMSAIKQRRGESEVVYE
jgi:Formin Homology 2 Domain/Subunit CCDC53 of WASH complex